jgi:uncharacterized protein
MKWEGRRQSDNVEDQRDDSSDGGGGFGGGGGFRPRGFGVRGGGGGGLSKIIMIIVLFVVLQRCGIDPSFLLAELGGGSFAPQQSSIPAQSIPQNDKITAFVKTVLADTEDTWIEIFKAEGEVYPEPTLVLFNGQVRSACGFASSATGPFYCPGDQKIYIDLSFYDQLARQFDAAGDFAQAYVLAHEVGHHVQNITGILPKFHQARQGMSEKQANEMSVRVELQADCYAGVWGHFTRQKDLLEAGDIDEALNAAMQIGDDTLQRKAQGYVVPESFNHGTSEQRKAWFKRGFDSGKLTDCDTFKNDV